MLYLLRNVVGLMLTVVFLDLLRCVVGLISTVGYVALCLGSDFYCCICCVVSWV